MRSLCGQRLGHYQIKELIGAGGMGEVYRALDEQLDREVAVKVLPERTALDADAINRFKREAKAVAALSHPSILAIHDFGQEGDLCYAVTELLDGETLDQRLSRGPLDAEGVIEISLAIAEALAAAHDKGIVHRDLKPKNVFLTTAGGVKLLDFGLARVTAGVFDQTLSYHDSNTQAGTVLGTPHYMSPEQVRGATVDHHSDLFSFGTVLFEMGTGSHPFARETAAETMTAILNDPPQKSERALPAPLHSLALRCLQKSPAARFQSARDVVTILKEARSGSHQALAISAAAPRGRLAWVLAAGVLAVAATGLLAWRPAVNTGALPPKPPIAATVPSEAEIARQEYLPKIIQYSETGEFSKAWDLAVKAREVIPNDRVLNGLWNRFSLAVSVTTTPAGAEVFVRDYDAVDNVWTSLGKTPINRARISLGLNRRLQGAGISQGLKRWRIVKDGSATLEFAGLPASFDLELPAASQVPPEMVYVPKGKNLRSRVVKLVGMQSSGPDPELDAFLIDRHEVTNKQFKEFVDGGGYRNRGLWKHEFDKAGETLPWEEAMKLFLDATGRPGPAAWALGEYPHGAVNLPVTGVSWHEAAAYAEFVNKRLPTVYHWLRAANLNWAEFIIPQSNFEGESIAPVGTFPGIAAFGCYDMAGNVSEWASNTVNERYVSLGGCWTDKAYMFGFPKFNSPFDRNATTGFRCVRLLGDGALSGEVAGPILVVRRDYSLEKPSDDTLFAVYQRHFDYDPGELEPRVEPQKTTPTVRDGIWNREIITVNAAYDNERLKLHLFLPKRGKPPFQTVVYFPGSGAVSPSAVVPEASFSFLAKGGRAVVYPIYKGTHDRNEGLTSNWPEETTRFADYLVKWVKDLRRSLDYVATRPELDAQRVAYYGASWGARMGIVIPAVEPRIRVSVLALGGLPQAFSRPEVDPFNFAPRVTIPTLMLNGRYDSIYPVEECQLPLFRLLGTPPEHKRHMIYDTAHAVPQNESIKETLNWLDRYLGPVESQESAAAPPP